MSDINDKDLENKIEAIEKRKSPARAIAFVGLGVVIVAGFAFTSAWVVDYIEKSRVSTEQSVTSAKNQYLIEIEELRKSISQIKNKTDDVTRYSILKEQIAEIGRKQESILLAQGVINKSLEEIKLKNTSIDEEFSKLEAGLTSNIDKVNNLESSLRLIAGDANQAKSVSSNIDERIEKAVSDYMKGNKKVSASSIKVKCVDSASSKCLDKKPAKATTPIKLKTTSTRKTIRKPITVYAKNMESINGFTLFSIDNWGGQAMATLQSASGDTKSISQGDTFGGYLFKKMDNSRNTVLVVKDGRTWELK
ncbi:hypothetical protein [Motilimonas cestriensis]|uniref:hypothetical protein n=1 Tax=Motilimonas cestriensis TaxID=2742685 RepID=UPI003DA65F05